MQVQIRGAIYLEVPFISEHSFVLALSLVLVSRELFVEKWGSQCQVIGNFVFSEKGTLKLYIARSISVIMINEFNFTEQI